jgi:hypothetical protein
LYAYHPARHLPPAKVRAFLDFVQQIAREKARQGSSLPTGETSDLLKVRETPGDPFHHPDTR